MLHVPDHGFTQTSLKLGAQDAGYLPVSVNLFRRGAFDLINYHLVTQRLSLKDNSRLQSSLEQSTPQPGIGARVSELVLARLLANQPTIHRWQDVRHRPVFRVFFLCPRAHLP